MVKKEGRCEPAPYQTDGIVDEDLAEKSAVARGILRRDAVNGASSRSSSRPKPSNRRG
jgi:hypothetical protein